MGIAYGVARRCARIGTGRLHIFSSAQRIDAQLTTLDVALEYLRAHCAPAAEQLTELDASADGFVSRDILAPFSRPAHDVAARDGFSAASVDLIGASSFNPACLMAAPVPVSVGDPMPDGCDCVVEFGCVGLDGPPFTINVSAAPGEGVRRAGVDAAAGAVLLRAGSKIDPFHKVLLQLAGVTQVSVRHPRVRIVGVPSFDGGAQTFALMSSLLARVGVLPEPAFCTSRRAGDIVEEIAAQQEAKGLPDLLITIGGSGAGAGDQCVEALRRLGARLFHGLALSAGSTIAGGVVRGRPVIALPGRFDGALAGWLAVVAPVLQLLCGARPAAPLESGRLLRKLSSAPGVSDVVLLERTDLGWSPSPAGDMSVAQALRADGYLLIGAGSEGLAEGANVRPLPFPQLGAHS